MIFGPVQGLVMCGVFEILVACKWESCVLEVWNFGVLKWLIFVCIVYCDVCVSLVKPC